MCLDRNWNMWIPGFGSEDLRPYKKAPATEAHKQVSSIHYFTIFRKKNVNVNTNKDTVILEESRNMLSLFLEK